MIYGWDGADYQKYPDVAQMRRDGHDFCIEKVTGEGNYVNPYWPKIRDDCRINGVIFGSYDWIQPQLWRTIQDAIAGAKEYFTTLGTIRLGELICVDFEDPKWFTGPLGRNIEGVCRAYFYALRDLAGGKIIIYTAPYFLSETGASGWTWLTEANGLFLWQAAPGPAKNTATMLEDNSQWPSTPAPFTRTVIHQHQWYAVGKGIAIQFDRNRFQGTRAELQSYGYQGGTIVQEEDYMIPPVGKTEVQLIKGQAIVVTNYGPDERDVVQASVNTVDQGVTMTNLDGDTFNRSQIKNVMQDYMPVPKGK